MTEEGNQLDNQKGPSKLVGSIAKDLSSIDDQEPSSIKPESPAKRGRKRKTVPEQSNPTIFIPVPAADKKFRTNRLWKDPNLADPSGASKMRSRKNPPVPTHLCLQGRSSEECEPIKQKDEKVSSDFQCQKCSFVGKKIIHHYVNDHPYVEVPFVTMPESEWKAISSQAPSIVPGLPAHHQIDPDLSWISARLCYTNPVQCKLCSYTTCRRSELVEHVILHALPPNSKYRCALCHRLETNFFDMLDHIAGHTGEFRHQCNYCDLKFADRSEIKDHLNCVHESQDGYFCTSNFQSDSGQLWIYGFVCTTCRYVQMTQENMNNHQDLHSKCDGFSKVSLISFVQDDNASTTVPEGGNLTVSCPAEKEDGGNEVKHLYKTTKPHQSVSLVETLVKKVIDPYPDQEINPPVLMLIDDLDSRKVETGSDLPADDQETNPPVLKLIKDLDRPKVETRSDLSADIKEIENILQELKVIFIIN